MPLRLCGFGDNVVDRYVDRGTMFPGGNAVNVAVHAARNGARAGYVGVVGDDAEGMLVRNALLTEGVDIARLRVVHGPTAFATVHHDPAGNRSFGLCDKGVSVFEPSPDDLAHLQGFDLVHLAESMHMESWVPRLAAHTAVSFDVSERDDGFAEHLLPFLDVVTFSRAHTDDDAVHTTIDRAHAAGVRLVVVTRGDRGSVVSDGGTRHMQRPAPAAVVDTLGAGDSFIAALLTALAEGSALAEAADTAAVYAARVCELDGGFGHSRPLAPTSTKAEQSA